MSQEIAQAVVDGLVLGCLISVAALGMTLLWRIEGFPNIAQGEYLTLSGYFAFALNVSWGLPLLPAAGLAVVGGTAAVVVTYLIAFRPLRGSRAVVLLVTSLGVSLALRGLIGLKWGTELHALELPLLRDYSYWGVRINPLEVVVLGATCALVLLLWLFTYRTRLGVELRAVADLPDLARVSGINSRTVLFTVWTVAGIVSATGGVLLATQVNLTPLIGWNLLLPIFAATILGGVGSLVGSVLGGIVIGVGSQVTTLWISSSWRVAFAFVILTLVLMVRPRGLFASA